MAAKANPPPTDTRLTSQHLRPEPASHGFGRSRGPSPWCRARKRSARTVWSLTVVSALGVAGQSVVGDRLPRCGVCDELTDARPDPGIAVERAHPDGDRVGVAGGVGEQR